MTAPAPRNQLALWQALAIAGYALAPLAWLVALCAAGMASDNYHDPDAPESMGFMAGSVSWLFFGFVFVLALAPALVHQILRRRPVAATVIVVAAVIGVAAQIGWQVWLYRG